MRIRKRFLSLSAAITSTPSSDLHTADHRQQPLPLVQHQELHPNGNPYLLYDTTRSRFSDHQNHCHRRPLTPYSSDRSIQIGLQHSALVSSGGGNDPKNTKELESGTKKEIIETAETGCRKESISEANNHDLVLKGWLEGDRLIPIKKRRGSFGKRLDHDSEEDNEMIEGTMKPKPKNKNDKCARTSSKRNKKNEKKGNVIMEGSRCSRVNGRGWRCSQQTLVGYSLCEHHLGKGRLRSTTNVCVRTHKVGFKKQEAKSKDKEAEATPTHDDDDDDDDDDELKDWEVESMSSMEGTKIISKRRKVGVVKARSLSSLLRNIGS